jgi:signal transduction histidine kinase
MMIMRPLSWVVGVTRTETAPRLARGVVVVVIAALLSVHLLRAFGQISTHPTAGVTTAIACLGIFVVAARHLSANDRRRQVWRLAVLLVLAYVGVISCGASVGLLCVPVAALLLDRRWSLLALVLASAVGIEAARSGSARDTTDMALSVAVGGVMLYAVTMLALFANRVLSARLARTASAVTDERLRIAGELGAELDAGVAEIRAVAATGSSDAPDAVITTARRTLTETRAVAGELRSLSLAPEAASASALLEAAGIAVDLRLGHSEPLGPAGTVLAVVLREAVTAVVRLGDARRCEITTAEDGSRVTLLVSSDGVRAAATGADAFAELTERVGQAGGRLTAGLRADGRFAVEATVAATARADPPSDGPELRTALGLYAFLLASFCVRTLLFVPVALLAPAIACVIVLCALQVRFSIQDKTRYARPALLVSAAIAFIPLPWFGRNWIGAVGIVAGSVLIAAPLAIAIPLVGVALVISGVLGAAGPADAINALITCLVVYGVLRLVRLVREIDNANAELARAAVLAERLRAARDLHDLLGHGLTAILLKAELARRVSASDPARCRAELQDIERIAVRAQDELRTVSVASGELSFADELASAEAVLSGAGVAVEVDGVAPPLELESTLSVVLREAVTNVLRHSSARHVRIAVTVAGGITRLDVENDGVTGRVSDPGSGIGGLAIRLSEAGGRLSAGPDDGWYLVRAQIPSGDPAAPPAVSPEHRAGSLQVAATASPLPARSAPHRSGSAR